MGSASLVNCNCVSLMALDIMYCDINFITLIVPREIALFLVCNLGIGKFPTFYVKVSFAVQPFEVFTYSSSTSNYADCLTVHGCDHV